MNSPAKDIAEYLASSTGGSIGTIGTDLFYHEEPSIQSEMITILDEPGEAPDVNNNYERPYITVRVKERAGKYDTGYATMRSIRAVLHGLKYTDINGTRYLGIWQVGDILNLGLDDNSRPVLTVSYRIHRAD